MRIKVTLPRAWPVVSDEPYIAEVLPGVTLTLGALVPLPQDLKEWGDDLVFGELPHDEVRVALVKDMGTASDWPISLFGSDVIHPRTRAVLERRLHAMLRFDRHGAVAVLRSANTIYFDAVVKDVIDVLLGAEPDWSGDELLHLEELWTGLAIEKIEVDPATAVPPPELPKVPSPLFDY